MNIGILTSSRADYGIYLPLLRRLSQGGSFKLFIFAFGTHVSHFHAYNIEKLIADNWGEVVPVESMVLGDSPEAISTAIGLTTIKFSSVWQKYEGELNLIICLGDRYEMFAAVSAAVPFNIPICHIHGGETSLGAIDNIFRHSLTQMASLHFVSTEQYAEKVRKLSDENAQVWNVGALSLDNIQQMELYSVSDFHRKFGIDLNIPSILTTFHPETKAGEKNLQYVEELIQAILLSRDYQWIITMPNADTFGNRIREKLNDIIDQNPSIIGIENFGTRAYFSAMKHCKFLLGNTSSGILEAASFCKFVVNLGYRQKGRACSENVIHTPINTAAILDAIARAASLGEYTGNNIYWNGGASDRIYNVLANLSK